MKAILVKTNEEYRDLLYRIQHQHWDILRGEGFPEKDFFETGQEYLTRVLRERQISCLDKTECEILHIDYADFGCIVLHNDGTLTKESLRDIRIKKDQDNESSGMAETSEGGDQETQAL